MDDPKFQHNGMPYVSIHGGPGTHGAGGGGSGGGVVGQGQGDDEPSQQQQQQSSSSKSYPSSPIDVASPTGSGSRRSKSIGKRSLYDDGPQLSGPTEGWNAWEREKMEELLNETRGHLGELNLLVTSE
jgi:phospholipase D1/2